MTKKLLILITALLISYTSFGQSISAGEKHSMFLCPDGSVKSWGNNEHGQLGHNDLTSKKLPTAITGISGVIAIEAGFSHSLFLKSDSTVWACGNNEYGQLGIGSNNKEISPVQITSLGGIIAVSANYSHSLFLKNDGTVWACGDGSYGALGNGSNSNSNVPVKIDTLNNIIDISGGAWYSLFLKNDGTVWACGYNDAGQLGVGSNQMIYEPYKIDNLSNVIAISAGASHSLFLKNDGSVFACGSNFLGQIGSGLPSYTNPNVAQIQLISNITAISAGVGHSFFLKNDGTVWACGSSYGVVDGIIYEFGSTPSQISGLNNVNGISSGSNFTLFAKNDGTVSTSGVNTYGQLGNGTNNSITQLTNLGNICVPPTPPQVDFSNFPNSLCVGSTINIEPSISGSLPDIGFTIDNSINVTAPKNLAKNSHAVFVLDGANIITSYDLNGNLLNTYNAASTFTGLTSMAPDESDNVWIHNAPNQRLVRLGPGGPTDTSSITGLALWTNMSVTDMAFADVPSSVLIEDFIVVDTSGNGDLMTSYDVTNTDPFSNSQFGLSDSTYSLLGRGKITSIAFDNQLYAERRMLFADPQHNTLWQRRFQGGDWFHSATYLVDTAVTSGMAFDFIETDTTFKIDGHGASVITVSSSSKNIIGTIYTNVSPNGEINSFIDTVMMSSIVTQMPVGMVSASNNNMPQLWIADKGLNKLIRAQMISYRLTPNLPAGLRFNTLSGQVEGTPTAVLAPQTFQLIVSNGLGSDTSYFTFGVTPTGPLSNLAGTSSTSGTHNDGLTIKYYEANNCGELIEIADAIGGTTPGQSQISQTVYPLVSVIANDSLIRRVNSIRADNQDALTVNVKLFYSYQDIQAFNVTRGSALLSNDTIGGTMQMAVLQMHDKPDGSKEPIIHSPIAAVWSNTKHHWEATVPVTKFSEFYGSDMGTLATFDCSNTGADTLNLPTSYYVWNYDTLFTSGTYVDTLINKTGCDSITTLNITLSPVGLNEASIGSGYAIYPNPSAGVFNISNTSSATVVSKVRVLNVLGNVVYTAQIIGSGKIDLSQQEAEFILL